MEGGIFVKRIITAILLFCIICMISFGFTTSYAEDAVTLNEILNINIDNIYGVSMFPYLREPKTDDTNAIRKFAEELLSFRFIPIDRNSAIEKIKSTIDGVFIEFYDKNEKWICGLYIEDGYIEKNYVPQMSRTPIYTHKAENISEITDWLDNYINLWRTDITKSEQNTTDNPDITMPSMAECADILNKLGLFYGTDKGYELERLVTRAEAITMILRVIGEDKSALLPGNLRSFSDVDVSHWAYANIGYAAYKGYISGTSPTTFEPDRYVTGLEFIRMLLTSMGYREVTLENAYKEGLKYGLLREESVKNAVSDKDYKLLRSDVVSICYSALFAKKPDGKLLKDVLIEMEKIDEEILNKLTNIKTMVASKGFAWTLNAFMPEDENYMFSPLSIKMALAMASAGAAGETRNEILNTLQIDDLNKYFAYAKQLIKDYSENEIVQLNIANSLWLNTDYLKNVKFRDDFKNIIQNYFNADSEEVNNLNAVDKINNWVKNKTNNKITELVSDSDFLAYIINAIYFKGEWAVQFNEKNTEKDDFTDRNNVKTKIDFMNNIGYYQYYSDSNLKMIKIPYKDMKTSMYIAMTDNNDADFESAIDKMQSKRVQLSIPKFKTEFKVSLKDTLYKMGIKTAFNKNIADFNNMFAGLQENAFISDVIHKTYINVDENGTEAAAVTGISVGATSMPPQEEPVVFKADRPFTYFIRDDVNGVILFIGEYAFVN